MLASLFGLAAVCPGGLVLRLGKVKVELEDFTRGI